MDDWVTQRSIDTTFLLLSRSILPWVVTDSADWCLKNRCYTTKRWLSTKRSLFKVSQVHVVSGKMQDGLLSFQWEIRQKQTCVDALSNSAWAAPGSALHKKLDSLVGASDFHSWKATPNIKPACNNACKEFGNSCSHKADYFWSKRRKIWTNGTKNLGKIWIYHISWCRQTVAMQNIKPRCKCIGTRTLNNFNSLHLHVESRQVISCNNASAIIMDWSRERQVVRLTPEKSWPRPFCHLSGPRKD